MELRQLRYFCAIAQTCSFSRAAEAHFVAQPALSQQIQKLEAELGVVLFDRTSRPIRITPAGAYLLPQAAAVLAGVQRIADDALDFAGEVRGRLVIGAMQYLASFELPDLLAAFRERYPAVELQLRMANTGQLVQLVQAGDIDIAFCHSDGLHTGTELAIETLRREELVVIVSREHPLAGRDTAAIQDLVGLPFITFHRGASTHDALLDAFAQIGEVPRVSFDSADLSAAFALVKHGLGVAMVPRSVAVRDPSVSMLSMSPAAVTRTVAQVWRTDRRSSQAQAALIRLAHTGLGGPGSMTGSPPPRADGGA